MNPNKKCEWQEKKEQGKSLIWGGGLCALGWFDSSDKTSLFNTGASNGSSFKQWIVGYWTKCLPSCTRSQGGCKSCTWVSCSDQTINVPNLSFRLWKGTDTNKKRDLKNVEEKKSHVDSWSKFDSVYNHLCRISFMIIELVPVWRSSSTDHHYLSFQSLVNLNLPHFLCEGQPTRFPKQLQVFL